jgi:hypothetical protein
MTIAAPAFAPEFMSVQESEPFSTLFPHRFDFIYAEHAQPGQSPNWQTESRYPLSDRVLDQGGFLYGVRFGSQTAYCVLDIDIDSFYHPQQDAFAVGRILSALEPIGLTAYLGCTSSYSGGIHLYFPLDKPIASWELASAVSTLLETAGFKLKPGQLEIFPNPKPYSAESSPRLFSAHRLPLQAGSYLLDSDFQPIWSDRDRFVRQWRSLQPNNQIDRKGLRRVLQQAKRQFRRFSGKVDKFISDLNAEINSGWTGFGQTNRLLGRIAMREYIFHHVLCGGDPLVGEALVGEIVRVARSLPGYSEWCRHQPEIEQRAEEWARCIEASHYFHYGSSKGKYKSAGSDGSICLSEESSDHLPSWNQHQSESARARIQAAIAMLLEQNRLPCGATARFRLLTQFGVGGTSLYRHRDLWHPTFLLAAKDEFTAGDLLEGDLTESNLLKSEFNSGLLVENPPDPPSSFEDEKMDCLGTASIFSHPTSLLSAIGSNPLPALDSRCFFQPDTVSTGSNLLCFVSEAIDDFSDLLVGISVQVRRLGWDAGQLRDRLLQLFGKPSQALLVSWELERWLEWLEDYP